MAITLVPGQIAQAENASGTTVTATLPNVPTAGNLVVAVVSDSAGSASVMAVRDSALNNYTPTPKTPFNTSPPVGNTGIFYFVATATAGRSITFTDSVSNTLDIFVAEFTGNVLAGVLEADATNNTITGGSPVDLPSITTISSGALLIAAEICNSNCIGVNAPWVGWSPGVPASANYAAYCLQPVAGAQPVSFLTLGGSWNCLVASFKAATISPALVASPQVTATGSSFDIVNRVKGVIAKRWFSYVAPYRDAILGGLADSAAWSYLLVGYARAQSRLATAYGVWLDIFAFDYLGRFLIRNGRLDDAFRAVIKATVLQERVTRKGMVNAITAITGNAPTIFEPWNTRDTSAYSSPGHAGRTQAPMMGYNVGKGGYGNMQLNNQVFIQVVRGSGSGVPGIGGYGGNLAGYGVGATEYIGPGSEMSGITDAMIYDMINKTKPTGCTCWIQFGAATQTLTSEAGTILTDESGTIILTSH
jgi:hypothetical protein